MDEIDTLFDKVGLRVTEAHLMLDEPKSFLSLKALEQFRLFEVILSQGRDSD